ncbi:MAG: MATE family efflux transporter [Pseudomonadota bacterium]
MFRSEVRELVRLSLPIATTQLAQIGMGVVDATMAGRVSAADLAGVSLGGSMFWPIMILSSGLILAVTPTVAQLDGAGRRADSGEVVRQALWIALLGGTLGILALGQAAFFYGFMEVDPRAIPISVAYLDSMRWGLLPVLGYFALRYLCDGLSWTLPAMLIAVGALLLKIPLSYLFVFGGLGIDGRGGAGCGIATAIVMALEFAVMLLVVAFSRIRASGFFARWSWPDPARIRRLVVLGMPIGLAQFAEMAIFSVVTLFIGRLGVEAVASHQIALNVSSLLFMIPLSLGMAASIRVGFNVGRGAVPVARQAGLAALALSLAIGCLGVLLLLFYRYELVGLYTDEAAVIAVAGGLLVLAAIYTPFDYVQATAIGILRGYKDTGVPMVIALFSYWAIAMPLGRGLGFGELGMPELGLDGFWIALIVGLGVAAVVLSLRFFWLSARPERIERLAAG